MNVIVGCVLVGEYTAGFVGWVNASPRDPGPGFSRHIMQNLHMHTHKQ